MAAMQRQTLQPTRTLTTNIGLEGACSIDLVESVADFFGAALPAAREFISEVVQPLPTGVPPLPSAPVVRNQQNCQRLRARRPEESTRNVTGAKWSGGAPRSVVGNSKRRARQLCRTAGRPGGRSTMKGSIRRIRVRFKDANQLAVRRSRKWPRKAVSARR